MQKEIERKSLIVSTIINTIITGAGLWVFTVSNIQALFIDFFFSFIALVSTILAVVISKQSIKKTKSYPDGLAFLEPLYAILKSILTLVLLIFSAVVTSIAAYQYFAHGIGEAINIGPVLPYTISMVILCFGLGFFNKFQNKKINNLSTMLAAESKSNFIDGLQSFGIGVAIVFLFFVDKNGSLGFLHYTGDFFITIALVLMSLKQPIKMIMTSFKELSHGVTDDAVILSTVDDVVKSHLGDSDMYKRCDVFKIGMHLKIRVLLHTDSNEDTIHRLTEARQKVLQELKMTYDSVELDFAF